jgi:glucosamine-6-phosphate deaminase
MPFKVIVTRDFDHMSEVAASILVDSVKEALGKKGGCVLGLATGNSPTGLYKQLAKAANAGAFDPSRVQSFNLDEYIGLPGENAQQRALHRESYSFFMIQELFSLLQKKFAESSVPWGTLIDQGRLVAELTAHPEDYVMQGRDKGKAVVIKPDARSDYLRWIRSEILDEYEKKIAAAGGIDLQVVGVGGRGHVAFHEAGIPFEGNRMLLVKLDDNTVKNAVTDGHFATTEESPQYAISMGAELVYKAKAVLLLASGSRKAEPVAESLLREPDCSVPISYGQLSSREGRRVVYVLDKAAAARTLENIDAIGARGIEVEDISDREA